jgi:hypothetical protein
VSKGQITDKMAAQIKAMKYRGDLNQDIAAWFGINPGRISEICGKNPKPQYRSVLPETKDIPPPGPYDFGGGGIVGLYRTLVEVRNKWDGGDLRQARVHFERAYKSMGRSKTTDEIDEIVAEIFYDDRGIPNFHSD